MSSINKRYPSEMPYSKMEKVDIEDPFESHGLLGQNDLIACKGAEIATKVRRRIFWVLSVGNVILFLVSIFMVSFSWKTRRFVFRNGGNVLLKEIDAYCK